MMKWYDESDAKKMSKPKVPVKSGKKGDGEDDTAHA